MPGIERVRYAEISPGETHAAPSCRASTRVESRRLSPAGASLWLVESVLPKDSALQWETGHGDEALYVASGALRIGDRTCPARGAAILEAGARPRVEVVDDAKVLHFGAASPPGSTSPTGSTGSTGPPAPGQPGVHVTTPRGTWERCEPGRDTRFFADATCPTCRVWLLYTSRGQAFESPVHSHSQDELIHVLTGGIRLGSLGLGPGDTLYVEAGQPYRLRADDPGFGFLNYRCDASEMSVRGADDVVIESGATTGMRPVPDLA